jgi:hypothetical protein
MSLPARVSVLVGAVIVVVALVIFVVIHFLISGPPTENYAAGVVPDTGQTVHVTMQEDPQNSVTSHPDWVSYFIKSPTTGAWVHTTLFQVPAGSRIDMTVIGYDGCTPLRNPIWGEVMGTVGGVEYVDGKPVKQLNSWAECSVAHTFSIPQLGLSVPMAAASSNPAATLCGTSPCTSGPHQVIQFSFMTPRTGGSYFWQCRIPCGGGFLDGFGGPMETIGFMTGTMQVVA